MSSPPPVAFQTRYIGWIIGVVEVLLAVLGLLGIVPFEPKIVFGMLLVQAVAVFV